MTGVDLGFWLLFAYLLVFWRLIVCLLFIYNSVGCVAGSDLLLLFVLFMIWISWFVYVCLCGLVACLCLLFVYVLVFGWLLV